MAKSQEPRTGGPSGSSRAAGRSRRGDAALPRTLEGGRDSFDDAPAALVVLSPAGVVLEANDFFCRLAGGSTVSDLLGRRFVSLLPAEEAPRFLSHLEACLAAARRSAPQVGPAFELRFRLLVAGGGEVLVQSRCRARLDSPGSDAARYFLAAAEDQGTARVRGARQAQYEQTLGFIEAAADAIITTDEWGRIETFNPAAERVFGYQRGEATGRGLEILFPDYGQVPGSEACEESEEGDAVGRSLGRFGRRKGGEVFPMDFTMTEVRLGGRHGWIAIIRDVSERERLKRAVVETSEREQRRLGRDLHDGLSQILAGVSFLAGALEHRLNARSLPEATDARRLVTLVGDALSQVRQMARGLYPVEIETKGLGPALASLAASTSHLGAVSCRFEAREGAEVLDPSVSMHLFRIAQEALHNALRHGKPRSVLISLGRERHRVVLKVVDDGAGIPEEAFRSDGLGLHSMRERARMVGGRLEIVANPQGGTTVACSLAPERPARSGARSRPPRS